MIKDFGPHFLIATESEAAAGAESISFESGQRVGVDPESLYGLGDESLAELRCLVTGRDYETNELHGSEQVYVWDEEHGPWLYRLPDDLVKALALLEDRAIVSVAQKWLNGSYTFQANEAPFSWVVQTVRKLATLAQKSVYTNKHMYWEVPCC